MNLEHLRAILWLRWRMSANQWRKLGAINAIVTTGIVVVGLIASVMLFFVTLVGGTLFMLHKPPSPDALMFTWDIIVAVFLFVWVIGLVTELQRSELLSLDRMLHLPLSLSGAFVLNYATSLLSLPMAIFLPGMMGLAIACIIVYGPMMLTVLPLLAAFMLFVTALTYQFRGWLATLMENKRRRKSIIVGVTMVFILLVQAPQLVNMMYMNGRSQARSDARKEYTEGLDELTRQLKAGEISREENEQRKDELKQQRNDRQKQASERMHASLTNNAVLANKVLPIGWLPYGIRSAANGSVVPGLLGSFVLFAVGGLSLWRSYGTTMRFYTGVRSTPKKRRVKDETSTARKLSNGVEARIPYLSEHVSGVAAAGFRSMLRAPESKMALMMPILFVVIFGGVVLVGPAREVDLKAFDWLPSYFAIAIIGSLLFGMAQLMINIFGMDRNGFRAYVLMPVPRRDILIGKNLSLTPFAAALVIVMLIALYAVLGMRITHLLATIVQLVPSYLLFCLAGNAASILAPMAIASGSLKPVQQNFKSVFIQMFFMMFSPIAILPAIAALSAEVGFEYLSGLHGWPIYLVMSVLEVVIVVWIYKSLVTIQGDWLQNREPRMLEILTDVPE